MCTHFRSIIDQAIRVLFFLGYFQSDCTGFHVILLGYFSKITCFFQFITRFLFSMVTLLGIFFRNRVQNTVVCTCKSITVLI